MKLLQVEIHIRDVNFSGQQSVNGAATKFLESRMPCNRQKIIMLHSLRLMIEKKNDSGPDQSSLVRILRREIHQCLRLVFFYFKGEPDKNRLQDFIDNLDRHDWLEMNDVRLYLAHYTITWLERQRVERAHVDDFNKLANFSRTLTRYLSYHPQQMPEPVHFEYAHVFGDWQKVGFFRSLIYEIDRLTWLVYLEGLSHSRGHSLDGLTGVPERKSFDDEVQRWMTRFKTDQAPFVCGMIDLDDFKKVNDTYGHQTGDFVLKEAAAFLKATLGPTDFIARYGGEEFVILLANLRLCQAEEKIAEAISRLGQLNFEYQGKQLRFTFSCGIAECRPSENVESLIDRADKNTYEAKWRGKNQVFSGVSVPEGGRSATVG
jgi:diguanylate cyclase (GGDEF)-like protein